MASYTFGPDSMSSIAQRLAEGGNTVTLRSGSYVLNKNSSNYAWKIGSNTTLIGLNGSVIVMGPTRSYPDTPSSGMILIESKSNIRITGVSFTGNNTSGNYGTLTNIMIVCNSCHHIEIDSCIFVNADSDFIKFRNCHDSSVHNNRMWYSGHECLYLLNSRSNDVCYNIGFYNNDCKTRENGAVRLGYSCHDIWIHHNTISGLSSGYSGNSFTGPAIEIDKGPTYNVDIYENTFTDIVGAGIWAFTNYEPTGSYNLLIHDNTFTRCAKASWLKKSDGTSAAWEYGKGDIVLYQIHNTKIYSNRFVSSGAHGALYIYNRNSTSHSGSTYNIQYTNNRGAASSDLKYTNGYSNHKITVSGNIVGTGGGAGTGGTTPPVVDTTTPVVAIRSDPTSIVTGGTTNLIWSATGCTSASLTRHASSTAAADWNYNIPLNGVGTNGGTLLVGPPTSCIYRITGVYSNVSPVKTAYTDCPVTVTTPTVPLPTCSSFYASKSNIMLGESVTLYVTNILNASLAHINGTHINYTGDQSLTVTPTVTTNYILTLGGAAGIKTYSLTVVVTEPPMPVTPTLTFTSSATVIDEGMTIRLDWETANTTSLTITPFGEILNFASGYRIEQPLSNITYVATATNTNGYSTKTTTKSISITVNPAPPPMAPTIALNVTDQEIDIDQSTTITWNVTTADTLTCDNIAGVLNAVSGSAVVSPTSNTTYEFTATGEGGITQRSIEVTVLSGDIVTLFTSTPTTVHAGEPVTLAWESRFGKYASIDNDIGSVTPCSGGTYTVYPTVSTDYQISISGSMGLDQTLTSVNVLDAILSGSNIPSAAFSIDCPIISPGEVATISWTTLNTNVMACGQNIGFVATPDGSLEVQPIVTTEYSFILANDEYSTEYIVPIYVMEDYEFIYETVPTYTQEYINMNARRIYVSGGQSTSDTTYSWDIDTNASIRPNPDNEMITFAYDETGFYTITLTSIDKDGNVLKQTVRANVVNI